LFNLICKHGHLVVAASLLDSKLIRLRYHWSPTLIIAFGLRDIHPKGLTECLSRCLGQWQFIAMLQSQWSLHHTRSWE